MEVEVSDADVVDGEFVTVHTTTPTFEEFFAARYAHMVRLAFLLGSRDPNEDTQEAFARVMLKYPSLSAKGSPDAYVRTTLTNVIRSAHRKNRVAKSHLSGLLEVEAARPDEIASSREESRRLVRAVWALPERQRQVIVLRYWESLSEQDIARVLGISVGSVKTHASRGMSAIRKVMD
jgi:RNA polymerase sigma factor (sigma-70 family)